MPREEDEDREEAQDAEEHGHDTAEQEDDCEWSGEENWDAGEKRSLKDQEGDEPISHEAEEDAEERADDQDARSNASGRSSDTAESWRRRRRSPSAGRDRHREDGVRPVPRRATGAGTLKATVSRVAGTLRPLQARARRSLGGPPVGAGPVGAAPVGARPLGRLSAQFAASARRLQQQAPWNAKGPAKGLGKSSKVGKSTAGVGDRLGRFAQGPRVLGKGDKGSRITVSIRGKGDKGDRPSSKGKGAGDKGDRPTSKGKGPVIVDRLNRGSKGDRLAGKGCSQGKTKGASYLPLRAPTSKGTKGALTAKGRSMQPVGGGSPVGGGTSSGPLAALRLKVGLRVRAPVVGASRTGSSLRESKFDKNTHGGRVFSESTRSIPLRPKPPWGKGATGGASGSSAEPRGSSAGASSSHRQTKGNGSSSGSKPGVREEAAQVISTATAALEKLLKVAGSGKLGSSSSSSAVIGSGRTGGSPGGGAVGRSSSTSAAVGSGAAAPAASSFGAGAIGSNSAGPPPRGSSSGGDGRGGGFRRITLEDNELKLHERKGSPVRRREVREATSRSRRRQEDRGRQRLRSRSSRPAGKQRWTQSPDNALPPLGRRGGKSPEAGSRRDGQAGTNSRRGQRDSPQRFSDRRDPPARRASRSRSRSRRSPVRRRRD